MKAITSTSIVVLALLLTSCAEEKAPRGWYIQDYTEDQTSVEQEVPTGEMPSSVVTGVSTASAGPADLGGIGVGPISSVELAEGIDMAMVEEGKGHFKTLCRSCHKMGKKFVGPPLGFVLQRRRPEWVLNMMLNPEKMVAEDPVAKALLEEYISPMANQNLTEDQARAILEYIREYELRKSEEG